MSEISTAAAVVLLAAFYLVELTGPDGQHIEVNPDGVVVLRAPRDTEEHFAKSINCLVFTNDGKFTGVQESCDTVRDLLLRMEEKKSRDVEDTKSREHQRSRDERAREQQR